MKICFILPSASLLQNDIADYLEGPLTNSTEVGDRDTATCKYGSSQGTSEIDLLNMCVNNCLSHMRSAKEFDTCDTCVVMGMWLN